jgi:uncharacterized protein (UPF0335 family)
MSPNFVRDQLRAFVERIERIEAEIAELNSDKRDIYAEAKHAGFDVKALKAVIAYRRKDPYEQEEHDAIFRLYLDTIQGKSDTGTRDATRVHVHDGSAAPAQPSAAPPEPARSIPMPDIPAHLDRRPHQ